MPKRLLFFTLLFLASLAGRTQDDRFANLKNLIHEKYPDIPLEDKIIAVNYLSAQDPHAEENSKAFEKAVSVYHSAILKNGREGLIVVNVCRDTPATETDLESEKDNLKKPLSFTEEEVQKVRLPKSTNLVFDSMGREIYRDLNGGNIFSSIQKLITR